MSIKLMSHAWESDVSGNELLILLCLADFANDDGYCYPSYRTVQQKCKVSKDTAWRCLKNLEKKGKIASFSRKRENGSTAVNGYYVLINLDRAGAKSEIRTPPTKQAKSEIRTPLLGAKSEIRTGAKSDSFGHLYEPSIVFNFSLPKEQNFEELDEEYLVRLEEEISKLNLSLSFEDFALKLQAKSYKYKNFLAAYKSWAKKQYTTNTTATNNTNIGDFEQRNKNFERERDAKIQKNLEAYYGL